MWRVWWPYKAAATLVVLMLAGANFLMQVDSVADFMGSPDLEYTDGIRASVFALVAASALFITLLPKNKVAGDDAVDSICKLLSVVAAFLAGVFWLLSETGGNFVPYVIVLIVVTATLTGILALYLFSGLAVDWVKQKKG